MENLTKRDGEGEKQMQAALRDQYVRIIQEVIGRNVPVRDGKVTLYVPPAVFLEHVSDDALRLIISRISHLAMWLTGCAGRLDPETFRLACAEPAFEVIHKLEEQVRARVGDVARGGIPYRGFNDIFPEFRDDPGQASAAIVSGVRDRLDEPAGELHQRVKLVRKRKR